MMMITCCIECHLILRVKILSYKTLFIDRAVNSFKILHQ